MKLLLSLDELLWAGFVLSGNIQQPHKHSSSLWQPRDTRRRVPKDRSKSEKLVGNSLLDWDRGWKVPLRPSHAANLADRGFYAAVQASETSLRP